jgi:hypothetical protein
MSEKQDIQVEDVPQEQDFLNMSDEEFANAQIENTQEDTQEVTSEAQEDDSITKVDESIEIDYKAEYERITAPFKANGKEVQVRSIDDAIQLMQMGADYQRKTTEIKPLRKIGEMLKQNDLLDAEQLSYLIDLKNKNPKAIQKLLKESGIDPLDIDTSEEVNYKPSNYQVDDKTIELNDVLDSIQHTPQFKRTSEVLGSEWDFESKQRLSANPKDILVINEDIGNGNYDIISNEVSRQRMLGNLNNVTDYDAYASVGKWLNEQGVFNKAQPQQQPVTTSVPTKPVQDNKQKKQAAGITKAATNKKTIDLASLDIMAMSDEEFAKLDKSLFR